MNNWIAALVIICSFLFGIMFGYGWGLQTAFNMGLEAARVMLDVELDGNARNMLLGFPPLLARLPQPLKEELNLTESEYKRTRLNQINQTISKIILYKYGEPNEKIDEKNKECNCRSIEFYKGKSFTPTWCENYLKEEYVAGSCFF
ncbi:MAG: hypothetical protein AABY22_24215 [Nanoarchaeota archaeon]